MTELVKYENNFLEMYEKEPRKIVAYGAGQCFRHHYTEIPSFDMICDRNADLIDTEIAGMKVSNPDKLSEFGESIYIVVFVVSYELFQEIYCQLQSYDISAKVIAFNNNVAFGWSYGATMRSYHKTDNNNEYSVNLVCYQDSWIYKKFADRMQQYMETSGIRVFRSEKAREDADINHHIPCLNFEPYKNDTLMITHIDDLKKAELLRKQLKTARMGICMSKETVDKLISYGIPAHKLCYINPAQDNVIKPQKYVIGITHRCYDGYDVRKRTAALLEIVEGINPQYFRFEIMGSGWEEIVSSLREREFEVLYFDRFEYEKYLKLMSEIDYYLFIGQDEGSMGYLDALAAGVGTIVTPQGFHLDTDCCIDYPCRTVAQFREAFLSLQGVREKKVKSVSGWTWGNYVRKHMEVWEYILGRKELKNLYGNQMLYEDGIFSTLLEDCRI